MTTQTRIEKTFANLNRPALVTFITAGDPNYDESLSVLKSLPNAGADIIELGMPFTDPMADGPAIQAAGLRALDAGATMQTTLQMVRDFRKDNQNTPIILMGYYNPVMQYGLDEFARDASQAGIDGLIIVDIPPEEAAPLTAAIKPHNIDLIRLITPTSNETRLPKLLNDASGFLYYVSITGVTGTAQADTKAVADHIAYIKTQTDLPVAIGFGIKTPEDAAQMAKIGDAIVVGSAIVQNIADHAGQSNMTDIVSNQVSALAQAIS